MTTIEWTRNDDGTAGRTWNPSTGCDRVSPGCDLCYALTMAKRLKGMGSQKYRNDGDPRTSGPGFRFTMHPDVVTAPLHWRKPTRVFVNSMSDLFHAHATREFLARVFAVMALTPQHTYQILTKRPLRMRRILTDEMFWVWVMAAMTDMRGAQCDVFNERMTALPGVWLGTSVETQKEADDRIPDLRATPGAVRFLSCEPLLAPIELAGRLDGIDWVIIGGESGPGARPMDPAWAQRIVDDCRAASVPVFMKQLGTILGGKSHHDIATFPAGLQHREYPSEVTA